MVENPKRSLSERIKWVATRPRALYRAGKALGWGTALQLVRIGISSRRETTYRLRIPGYPHPVFIRGGDSSDAVVLYEVLALEVYAESGNLRPDSFIIDGGANIGMASLYFLNRYPRARVVAVEPDPSTFELCRKNLEPYGDRVVLINGAIWKAAGRLALDVAKEERQTSVREDQAGTVEAFTIETLRGFGGGTIDLLKLDVEGAEKEIFGPGVQEWLPAVRNILIELHGDDTKDRFFSALEEYRYDVSLRCCWTDDQVDPPLSFYMSSCRNLERKALQPAIPGGRSPQHA
jgi:FkbM family methyltransferase